jgi:hypothetical protein
LTKKVAQKKAAHREDPTGGTASPITGVGGDRLVPGLSMPWDVKRA